MTTSLDSSPRVADVLDAVRELAPEIRARAAEVESARRVPLDLLDRLKAAGCFGLLLPSTHGGAGGDLAGAMRVFEELSRADASVGWIALIGGGGWLDLAGLPRSTFDAMYGPGRATIVAGVFNPTGTAVPVAGGYQVNGRWSFASGCEHADWIYGNCIDTSSGEPQLRIAVFRPDEVEIEDTWSVVGLCGTGSHHFNVHDVVVPAERTVNVFADPPSVESPSRASPSPPASRCCWPPCPSASPRPRSTTSWSSRPTRCRCCRRRRSPANPLFQYQLADADVKLRAARALLYEAAAEAWETGDGRRRVHATFRAQLVRPGCSRPRRRRRSSTPPIAPAAGARSTSRARSSVGCATCRP